MRGKLSRLVLFFAALPFLAAVSCSQPVFTGVFIPSNDLGRYEFDLDMSDSTARYDISFYSRIDNSKGREDGFMMDIEMVSPSGQKYADRVWYDYEESPVAEYASMLEPYEYGIWRMTVFARARGLRGMGLVCKREYNYGTRQTP